jgi:hypothetical protein
MRVRPYDPLAGTEQAGAVYFLPKARIEVGFTVKLEADIDDAKCESIVSECKYRFDAPEITDVTIGTQQLPDPSAGFVIETNQTFITTTNFDSFFSPKGELTAVAVSEQDRTLDFVAEGVGIITKLASVIAMAGPAQAATIQAQFKRRRALLTLLAKSDAALAEARPCIGAPPSASAPATGAHAAAAPGAKGKPTDPKTAPDGKAAAPTAQASAPCVTAADLRRTAELRKVLLRELDELNRELFVSKDVRVQCSFEPTRRLGSVDFRQDGGVCPAYGALQRKLAQVGFDVPLPGLTVQWQSTSAADRSAGGKGGASPGDPVGTGLPKPVDGTYAGIVYRIPEWFSVTVSRRASGDGATGAERGSTSGDVVPLGSDAVAIAGDVVALPQFGKLMTTSFDKADLRTGKELRIELHEGQGSLKRLSFRATPYEPKQVEPLLNAIPFPKAAPAPVLVDETTRLQEETKRALAEKAFIEAQRQLEQAKQQQPPTEELLAPSSGPPQGQGGASGPRPGSTAPEQPPAPR